MELQELKNIVLYRCMSEIKETWTDEFGGVYTADKKKVKMTYGEIANPDAEYTLDYKYNYTTKEIEI